MTETGTIILTGANGSLGLGFVQALLASYPQHILVATVRNTSPQSDPNTASLLKLLSKYPQSRVFVESLDLSSLTSVRSFADRISTRISAGKLPAISAIVCNAFTWSLNGQRQTSDGYEATFQVSHLSHFVLVLKLLGSMDPASGRVVMLGSEAHDPGKENPLAKLRAGFPDDLEHLVRPPPDEPLRVHDRGFARYGTAKLANVVFMHDLNQRLQAVSCQSFYPRTSDCRKGGLMRNFVCIPLQNPKLSAITATCMDPGGLVGSRAHSEQRGGIRRVFGIINVMMPLLRHLTSAVRTTADAGRDLVALSVGAEFQGKRGYFLGKHEAPPARVSLDEEVQKRLWEACWEWAGVTKGETVL
jgi:NAD(P)-dependent dehydrogenase (short-subunit alcohol dehydrogenase family)